MRIILCGFGVVGQSLVKLFDSRSEDLYAKYGLKPRVVGVFDSKGSAVDSSGLELEKLVEVKKKFGTVKLLAVHASTDTRFDFLQKRGRSDDPQTKEHFEERDNRELGVGISNSIALSDYAISNIGLTKEELIEQTFKIIQSWVE